MPPIQRVARIVGLGSLILFAGTVGSVFANVRLPHIFGDHMVLQRDKPVRVWGWADAGEKVTVTIGSEHAEATGDEHGRWKVELPPVSAKSALEVTVAGKNTIVLHDVLVGEVWICSGQSNMQWTVANSNDSKKEIAEAKHPNIRLCTVPMRPA